MGNIMISVNDEQEKEIRTYAQELYGGKKGSLSIFVWNAIAEYISNVQGKHERKSAVARMLNRMKNAKKLGILNKEGKAYSSRDDIYAERISKIHRH